MSSARAAHILVKSEKLAREIIKLLAKGEPFSKLAKKHSVCSSGKKGGDLGELKKGQMVKGFDEVVFKKPLLKIHGPVKTKFGYHVIKILSRS